MLEQDSKVVIHPKKKYTIKYFAEANQQITAATQEDLRAISRNGKAQETDATKKRESMLFQELQPLKTLSIDLFFTKDTKYNSAQIKDANSQNIFPDSNQLTDAIKRLANSNNPTSLLHNNPEQREFVISDDNKTMIGLQREGKKLKITNLTQTPVQFGFKVSASNVDPNLSSPKPTILKRLTNFQNSLILRSAQKANELRRSPANQNFFDGVDPLVKWGFYLGGGAALSGAFATALIFNLPRLQTNIATWEDFDLSSVALVDEISSQDTNTYSQTNQLTQDLSQALLNLITSAPPTQTLNIVNGVLQSNNLPNITKNNKSLRDTIIGTITEEVNSIELDNGESELIKDNTRTLLAVRLSAQLINQLYIEIAPHIEKKHQKEVFNQLQGFGIDLAINLCDGIGGSQVCVNRGVSPQTTGKAADQISIATAVLGIAGFNANTEYEDDNFIFKEDGDRQPVIFPLTNISVSKKATLHGY